MYKMYKNYKQRMEELERKHNIRINFRIILISNLFTAIFVGLLVYSIQNKIIKKTLDTKQIQSDIISDFYKEDKFKRKISSDINEDLIGLNPVLVNRLIKWLYAWQKVVPELGFSSFNKFEQKRLIIDTSLRYKLSDDEFNLRKNLYVFSPEKSKCIDPFYGRIIITQERSISKIKFDVSGMILLINPDDKTFQIVEMYGPSFDYDEAFWVNDEVFILAGSEIKYVDNRPVSYIRVPKISIYNLSERKVVSYYSFGVEEDNYQNLVKPQLVKILYDKISGK